MHLLVADLLMHFLSFLHYAVIQLHLVISDDKYGFTPAFSIDIRGFYAVIPEFLSL